ncbi:acyl-coenzyme A thioesterase 9, mitochondrial [Rhinophrynus dorsalis]
MRSKREGGIALPNFERYYLAAQSRYVIDFVSPRPRYQNTQMDVLLLHPAYRLSQFLHGGPAVFKTRVPMATALYGAWMELKQLLGYVAMNPDTPLHALPAQWGDRVPTVSTFPLLTRLMALEPQRPLSFIYQWLDSHIGRQEFSSRTKWEKDVGPLEDWEWDLAKAGPALVVMSTRHQMIQLNILHRIYYTPVRLFKMRGSGSDRCLRCDTAQGTYLHMIWECPGVRGFWNDVVRVLALVLGRPVPVTPKLCLLSIFPDEIEDATDRTLLSELLVMDNYILIYWLLQKQGQFLTLNMLFTLRDHVQAMENRTMLQPLLAKQQEDLPARKMKDSHIEALLPLGSQSQLREKYLTIHNSVRFGRILEDLDSLGVLICYTHAQTEDYQISPLSIVTAQVDKIDLCKKVIYPDCDIKFTGNVTWVGRSSMEVKMQMSQLRDQSYSPVLEASFVMVARDPENKRSAFINPIKLENTEEELIFKQGEENRLRRADVSTASLLKMAPTADERTIVHEMFLNTIDSRTASFRSRVLPPNSVWMEDAKLKSLEICHPQERNLFTRIFGGFLMRKAYELGWANACTYGGSRPYVVAVDDIIFQRPVEIGSLLFLSSQVCYTEGNYIQVRVHSEIFDPKTHERKTTNIFHFTYMSESEVPKLVPKSYGESMLYLDGRRHFHAVLKSKTEYN